MDINELLQHDEEHILDPEGSGDEELLEEPVKLAYDSAFENSTWETRMVEELRGEPIFRVIAFDKDFGPNSRLGLLIFVVVYGLSLFLQN